MRCTCQHCEPVTSGGVEPVPGVQLSNGATIVRVVARNERTRFVLAVAPTAHAYVTWVVELETGDSFWGHYFTDLNSAVADLERRATDWNAPA